MELEEADRSQLSMTDPELTGGDLAGSSSEESNSSEPCLSIMFCWGNTANGELGLGGIEDQHILSPTELHFHHSHTIHTIACGKSHTLVVTKNGQVYSCGNNDFGQLGHNNSRTRLQRVEGLDAYKIKSVACGDTHSMALNEWGQVYTWGSNSHGQLGLSDTEEGSPRPKMVKALATSFVVQISCGYRHCLALTNRGEVYSWGCNENGQLGLGIKVKVVGVPTLISSLIGLPVSLIASGGNHSFVVSKSGAVYGWGRNRFGQLGLNSQIDHIFPCQLKTLRSIMVKYIACGEDFSAFLTQDGGVLTCGAGQYGQLGHGSTSNEALPRKILELMGSTVTQICCGRKHTLAYIPSRERVYAFGLGGAGQLGNKLVANASSPQVVLGPWVTTGSNSPPVRINRLYSGGDHCFVTVSPFNGVSHSDDFREVPVDKRIWMITMERLIECASVPPEDNVDQELMAYLETVLGSQSCINGSFLMEKDLHYCCTSKNHGLDIPLVQRCFEAISRIQNESVQNLIRESLAQVLPSLPSSPPDAETLRQYVTIPMYHEFDNARHHQKLQTPFALALLRLKPEAAKIVGNWYLMQNTDFFERLVRVYKSVLLNLIKDSPSMNVQNHFDLNRGDPEIINILELLNRLNRLNHFKSPYKVAFETFHIPELQETIDIRVDYVRWVLEDPGNKLGKKYFCNYPFLFDAEAKTRLLETDQSMQMNSAMNEAAQRALTMMLFSPVLTQITAYLELHVSRTNIVDDTIRELANYTEKDFKKPLKITFLDEEAEDAGGVKKEFFLLIMKEILDPKYGMFTVDHESNAIWFSELSFEDEIMYYLVGLLCGLAIYNFTIINLPFPLALYKKLLDEPVDLQDLRALSPSLGNGLRSLLEYTEMDMEDVFGLKFELTREVYGEVRTTPLKPNGEEISVVQDNKEEYVELYVDYILNKSVERHFRAFKDAFHKVCGGRVLQLFHADELMNVVIGNENYDWEQFEEAANYKGGYSKNDPTIRMFWEVFHELDEEEKRKFLLFLTGSDRIPLQGMKAVPIIIQPTPDERFLPVAHTCFNLLDLPRYKTKERLRYKLLQSIQQTQGFSLV